MRHRPARGQRAPLVLLLLALLAAVLPLVAQPRAALAAATPGFDDAQPIGLGTDPVLAGEVADMDGDGDLDLIVGGYANTLLLLNDGTGVFPTFNLHANCADLPATVRCVTDPQAQRVGLLAAALVGDLDADGDLDVVEVRTDASSAQSYARLNDGAGNFPVSRPIGPSGPNESAALGDLDGDGDLDVVMGRFEGQNKIYRNDGSGSFSSGENFGFSADWTMDVALGDMNGDQQLDIIVANWGLPVEFGTPGSFEAYVYLNNGAGGFVDRRRFNFPNPGSYNLQAVNVGDTDGDGDLDLIAAYSNNQQGLVYLNDGAANFSQGAVRLLGGAGGFSGLSEPYDVIPADFDGDGHLDILLPHRGGPPAELFLNDGLGNFPAASRILVGPQSFQTFDAAVGDMNGDGDLDVVLFSDTHTTIFSGDGGGRFPAFPQTTAGRGNFGGPTDAVQAVAAGDIDGDGDRDLAVGKISGQSRFYLNDGAGVFSDGPAFEGPTSTVQELALGDLDGDTDLDLVVATNGQDTVLINDGAGGFATVRNLGPADHPAGGLALGDVDGDGDLDIAVAGGSLSSSGPASQAFELIFLNDGAGGFASGPVSSCLAPPAGVRCVDMAIQYGGTISTSASLGDLDGDGSLDLVVGNFAHEATVYYNDGRGGFSAERSLKMLNSADTDSAVGDFDGDGDLDIVLTSWQEPSAVYLNDGVGSFPVRSVVGFGTEPALSVAVGDVDNDGDLDIALGNNYYFNTQSQVFLNDGRANFTSTRFFGPDNEGMGDVALADMDGDGDLDVVAGHDCTVCVGEIEVQVGAQSRVYENRIHGALGLTDNPPRVRVSNPAPTDAGGLHFSPVVFTDRLITIGYSLSDPEGDQVERVRAFFSLDGGGSWRPAVAAAGTATTRLAAAPGGTSHSFVWDTYASGLFGRSDAVIFRIDALPNLRPRAGRVAGPFRRPFAAGLSTQFRVRGAEIQVLRPDSSPATGAIVYRLPAGELVGAQPYLGLGGAPRAVNSQGFLPGRGELGAGDRLVALLPVSAEGRVRRYLTSAAVGASGITPFTVSQPGVQTLRVAAGNALVTFDLTVSLEWDARNDRAYLEQLRADLLRSSELLYIWSDGQIALGRVSIFHDKERWDSADVQIYATNSLRPNANQGGIVAANTPDPTAAGVTYEPGQIRIGALWNRHGDAEGLPGEDWPRALAHEIGHWALYLDEDYLGLDPDGALISVEGCPSPMSDPYRDEFGQFRPDAGWLPACERTLNQQVSGRSNWGTIKRFYDSAALGWSLKQPASFSPATGPALLTLDLTTVVEQPLARAADTLPAPVFSLQSASGARYRAGLGARTVLFSADGTRLTDMGAPDQTEALARGARAGDRICVLDPGASHLGCETIRSGDTQLTMVAKPGWSPELLITPDGPTRFSISVGNLPAGLALRARLYASEGPPSSVVTLARAGSSYTGSVTVASPILAGQLHVYVDEAAPRREIVTDYALGGNPAPPKRPKQRKGRNAPALSPDGQVVLFGDSLEFSPGAYYAIQSVTNLPVPPPAWASPVGRGYRLIASANAPDLSRTSMNVGYLEQDVLPGTEGGIGLYYLPVGGTSWQRLSSRLDPDFNEIAAAARGPGFYVLMTSLSMRQGWNLLSYPWPDVAVPVADGLALLNAAGAFTTLYGYDPADSADPWEVYDVGAPAYVNDLTALRYGRGYWVNVSRASAGAAARDAAIAQLLPPARPATFYGTAVASDGYTPAAGQPVRAIIGGVVCAESQTFVDGGQVVFVLDVPAASDRAGCGVAGAAVRFELGGQPYGSATWADGRPQAVVPGVDPPGNTLYLPLLRG